jgi:uncharacterized membrane protein YbaN (DUF454 family)
MKRYLFLLIGLIATGLATLGVFVPGMPTTVFLIIALWAFAKSSERFHAWLMRAPIFKQAMTHVRHFEEHRAVTRKVKIIAQSFAWGSFLFVAVSLGPFSAAAILVCIAAISCSVVMRVLPTLHAK